MLLGKQYYEDGGKSKSAHRQQRTSVWVALSVFGCKISYSMAPPVTSKPMVDTGTALSTSSSSNTLQVLLRNTQAVQIYTFWAINSTALQAHL